MTSERSDRGGSASSPRTATSANRMRAAAAYRKQPYQTGGIWPTPILMTGQLTAQIRTSDRSSNQSRGLGLPVSARRAADRSERFTGRPQVELVGPGSAVLEMQP